MRDFLKRELAIGDTVLLIRPRYRELLLAQVTKFTAQKVEVTWSAKDWRGQDSKMLQDPSQVCKIDGADLTMYLLQNTPKK